MLLDWMPSWYHILTICGQLLKNPIAYRLEKRHVVGNPCIILDMQMLAVCDFESATKHPQSCTDCVNCLPVTLKHVGFDSRFEHL